MHRIALFLELSGQIQVDWHYTILSDSIGRIEVHDHFISEKISH